MATKPRFAAVKPVSFSELPFICRPAHGSMTANNWHVPATDDYSQACQAGREYASQFVRYLADNPGTAGASTLGHIAAAIDFADESAAKGYWVGFFSHLETQLNRH